jgi:hypothetical protein
MEQFLIQNQWILLLAILWSAMWKGFALWKSAQRKEIWWFVALFVLNTLGLLEILYIFVFSKKRPKESKKHFSAEEAKSIGEALGLDWSKFDVEQFRMGMDVELEHGLRDLHTNVTDDDSMTTGKIALAHLDEFPDYYTRLEKMEKEAEEFHKK